MNFFCMLAKCSYPRGRKKYGPVLKFAVKFPGDIKGGELFFSLHVLFPAFLLSSFSWLSAGTAGLAAGRQLGAPVRLEIPRCHSVRQIIIWAGNLGMVSFSSWNRLRVMITDEDRWDRYVVILSYHLTCLSKLYLYPICYIFIRLGFCGLGSSVWHVYLLDYQGMFLKKNNA